MDTILNIIIELLENGINLIKSKKIHRIEGFEIIIMPLHSKVEKLVENYFYVFRNSYELIKNSNSDEELFMALKEIQQMRNELWTIRTQMRYLILALQENNHNRNLNSYLKKIEGFFYITRVEDINYKKERLFSSRSRALVDLLENAVIGKCSKNELLQYIKTIESDLESMWISISQSYGYLQCDYFKHYIK